MRPISPITFSNSYSYPIYRNQNYIKNEPQTPPQDISFKGVNHAASKILNKNKINPLTDKIQFKPISKNSLIEENKLNILNNEIEKILSVPIAKAETKIEKIKCNTDDFIENQTTFYYDKNNIMICKNQGTGFIFYYNKSNNTNTFVSINETTGELVRANVELFENGNFSNKISYDIFRGFQAK